MKYRRVFLLLFLIVSISAFAQTKLPTQRRPAPQAQTDVEQQEQTVTEQRRIAALEFRGNHRFSSDTLRKYLKLVKEGEVYHKQKLAADLDRLRVLFYADRGYLKARHREPELEDTADGLKIVVTIDEGARYRFGEIKVEDATFFPPEEILKIIGVKTGEIARAYSVVNKGLERLNKLYRKNGYARIHVAFIPDFKEISPDEGIVDVTFEVEEGGVYFIRKIEFEGVEEDQAEVLRRELLIREGEIYNVYLFDKSFLRINQTGLFEEIKDDGEGAEVRIDDKNKQVDITFRLKPKAAPSRLPYTQTKPALKRRGDRNPNNINKIHA